MKIIGTRVVLRDEPHASDDEDSFRWHNIEEWNYYDEPDKYFRPVTRAEFDAWRQKPRKPSFTAHRWEIDTVEGRHIGWVGYYQHDVQAGSCYVGIDLPEEESWGRGYGTEALSLLLEHLFSSMGLQEIRTRTWTGNLRMQRVAEKCGFKEAAHLPHRAPISVRGEPLEFVEYSIAR